MWRLVTVNRWKMITIYILMNATRNQHQTKTTVMADAEIRTKQVCFDEETSTWPVLWYTCTYVCSNRWLVYTTISSQQLHTPLPSSAVRWLLKMYYVTPSIMRDVHLWPCWKPVHCILQDQGVIPVTCSQQEVVSVTLPSYVLVCWRGKCMAPPCLQEFMV